MHMKKKMIMMIKIKISIDRLFELYDAIGVTRPQWVKVLHVDFIILMQNQKGH